MNAYDILEERGFFYQVTDEAVVRERLNKPPVTFYVGFDPTGDSLHVGHLLPVMAMRFLQECGHRPIALVGGGTAMVGDPSGKTEARPILTAAEIDANAAALKAQLGRYLDFAAGGAILVNNADWLLPLNYIDFLRDVGRHFSVNRMLAAESVKQRLETGLSFLEFNYMLLQGYDFMALCRDRNCEFQLGGQDQWGNIVAGVDLTRRMLGRTVFGATFPLLTDNEGKKFGKTAGGAVWLDPNRTSVFDYYQFWRNVADVDVARLLALFTMLPMAEVRQLGALEPPAINRAKEVLAFEATRLAHGEAAARECFLAAGGQFGFADPEGRIATSSAVAQVNVAHAADLPTVTVAATDVAAGIWICKLLVDAGLCDSTSNGRRLIKGGGCYLNDVKITDLGREVGAVDFVDGELQLRSGKKNVRRIVVE